MIWYVNLPNAGIGVFAYVFPLTEVNRTRGVIRWWLMSLAERCGGAAEPHSCFFHGVLRGWSGWIGINELIA